MNKTLVAAIILNIALCSAAFAGTSNQTQNRPVAQSASQKTLSYNSEVGSMGGSSMVSNPALPGATGAALVIGDNSTIDGDMRATHMQQTGAFSP